MLITNGSERSEPNAYLIMFLKSIDPQVKNEIGLEPHVAGDVKTGRSVISHSQPDFHI